MRLPKNRAIRLMLPLIFMSGCIPALLAMDNRDLLKLKQAGFSDETIIHSINKETPEFDIRPDSLIALKQAGLSEAVIDRVMARQSEAPAAVTPVAAAIVPAPTAAPAVVTTAPATTAPVASAGEFGSPTPTASVASPTPASAPGPAEPDLFAINSPSIAPPLEEPVAGHDYFTRYSLHEEDGKSPTTNYARGGLVPINTPVHVVAISNRRIALKRLDNGESLYIVNVEKYSRKSVAQIASLLLSSAKTPIDRLAPPISNAIVAGEMRKGMTKEQVLMARGYPPGHETPSTDGDRWVYWSSRFIKQTVVFTNGRLTEGRQIE